MKKSNNNNLAGLFFLIFLFVGFILKNVYEDRSLEKNHRYTIGKIESIDIGSKGGFGTHFSYNVENIQFKESTVIDDYDKSIIGDRFYVKFSPKNPINCQLLLNERVPSYIQEAPTKGWKEIPRYLGRQP